MNTKTAGRELLTHLWRGGAWAYWWRPLPEAERGRGESLWFPTNIPAPLPAAWRGGDCYYGVHPGIANRGPTCRNKIDTVAAINCLYAEFDAKDYPAGKDGIADHLEAIYRDKRFPWPTAIVDSGGGWHCYWLLAQPFPLGDVNREDVRRLQWAWVKAAGADDEAKDLARVLRVPGTYNHKPHYAPDFPQVHFVEWSPLRLYDLPDLIEAAHDELEAMKPKPPPAVVPQTTNEVVGTTDSLLRGAVRQGTDGKRNAVGYWLAKKLREHGISKLGAESLLRDYARQVGGSGNRPYTEHEALATLRSVYGG
jgi:hypothetical protein